MIAPVTLPSFLQSYYESAPLLLHRGDPRYYEEVLTLDEVWRHIETRCPAVDEMSLIKLGAGQPEGGWTGPNGRADPARVIQLFNDGWTVGLKKMQDQLPALADLCSAAEAVFSCPFQTNLYLTPPGAQGFTAHWDTHDVFVLQVHGSKEWTLYDTQIALPLIGQSFDHDKPAPGPVSSTFRLEAGDMLYCPRGQMHSAQSSSETSLHITFGLMGRTWSDLLLEVLSEVSLKDVVLRRNLPVGFARPDFDSNAAAAEFGRVLAALVEGADFPTVLARVRDRFVSSRTRRLPGYVQQLDQIDQIGENSHARVRPNLIVSFDREEDLFSVSCGTSILTLPEFTESAVRTALAGGVFKVRDLPGPLDMEGKVTLVRRLLREGLVQLDGAAGPLTGTVTY